MKLLNPAGLWLLLGIPVLILIYMVKSRHEDRPVSSTYIWKLSMRFMKKKLPLQRFRRALLFILQLVMIAGLAFMAARPAVITGQSVEYIAIVDASASMQTKDTSGQSRFDRALAQVKELSAEINRGHRLTVIMASDTASYLIQSSDSVNNVNLALKNATCTFGGCDTTQALRLAQDICDRGNAEVYFYTDCAYPKVNNIQVVNLNTQEWNVSIDAIDISVDEEGEHYIDADITSHNEPCSVKVGLRLDGVLKTAKEVSLPADNATVVSFRADLPLGGGIWEVFVEQNDGLTADNSLMLCTGYNRTYNIALVSQSPLYLESALQSLGNCTVALYDTLKDVTLSGFDLYIYDGIYPKTYPTDGSVLQFGTETLPDGVSARKDVVRQTMLSIAPNKTALHSDTVFHDVVVSRYAPLSAGNQWQTVLRCATDPVCITRDMGMGHRFTLVSFDLHNSNLPMKTDYMVLMRNILENSVFDLIERVDFSVGEAVRLAVVPGATQFYVNLPDGNVKVMAPEDAYATFTPDAPGIYTAAVTTGDSGEFVDFYVHIPHDESVCPDGRGIGVNLMETVISPQDAIAEIWLWLGAALLLLLLLEWGGYCREQV